MRIGMLRVGALGAVVAMGSFAACGGTHPAQPAVAPAPSASGPKIAQAKGLVVAPRICNGRKLVGALVQQMAHRAEASDRKDRLDEGDDES